MNISLVAITVNNAVLTLTFHSTFELGEWVQAYGLGEYYVYWRAVSATTGAFVAGSHDG